jgi:hypothetical protein
MCKAPLPPTSPPTAFANIAQHWLDKYKKSNKKTQKNILDLSHSYPAIPAAPLPKAPKKLPKGYQKASKKHPKSNQKAPKKHPETLPDPTPEKVTKKTPLFCFLCCPWSPKWTPKGTHKSQKTA